MSYPKPSGEQAALVVPALKNIKQAQSENAKTTLRFFVVCAKMELT